MLVLPFVCIIPQGHSYCSFLCENDVNIKTIQEIMGHKNVSTTIDIYNEVSNSKKRKELSQIEENYISFSFKN
ncbi:MAG: tyrosine-type recombinase/integrase [Firmicutes bacterium]|nr:tyrosine-type recombinase/integrase [Bacillota bacterium]